MQYDFSVPKGVQRGQRDGNYGDRTPPDVDRSVLFGEDIRKTRIPGETMSQPYRAAFSDLQGNCFALSEDLLSKHLLLLGAIGCGKTNVFNFLIESLMARMTQDDVMLIFDTKGDFKNQFFRSSSPEHWLIGNDVQYERITRCWNIFDEMREPDGRFGKRSELVAKEISKQLFAGRESSTQPFFCQAASDLVSKALIHMMREAGRNHTERNLTTAHFVDFLQRANVKTYYDMTQSPYNRDFASAQLYFGKPGEKLTAQALGVFGYINSMLNDLFIGIFAEDKPAGSFSMRELIREKRKRVVFIEYDLSVGETLGPMYRLLFDLALKEALGGRSANRGNTYLIIDEFKLLPNLMHIDDALNFGRSLGVKVCAGMQSINQLYDIYGEDKAKALASGFGSSICFKTFDIDSRRYTMDLFGETCENLSLTSRAQPISMQREGHVIEDWNIQKLKVGEAYVKLYGYNPFFFQFMDFNKPHRVL